MPSPKIYKVTRKNSTFTWVVVAQTKKTARSLGASHFQVTEDMVTVEEIRGRVRMFGKKNKSPKSGGAAGVGNTGDVNDYRGLKKTLRYVRGAQNYGAVFAEVLILFAFTMSSLDVSLGGKLASIWGLAVMWGIAFAVGIDASFVLAWVRVRQVARQVGKRRHLWWAIPLALGMSFIVFQPVAIQQLQQSMGISFNQALANLGINLNFLVYARSFVAVFLGAILAMTNVETTPQAVVSTPAASLVSIKPELVQGTLAVQPVEQELVPIAQHSASLAELSTEDADLAELSAELADISTELAIPGMDLAEPNTELARVSMKLARLSTKQDILARLHAIPDINLNDLARETDVPYSTLTSWRRKIENERGE